MLVLNTTKDFLAAAKTFFIHDPGQVPHVISAMIEWLRLDMLGRWLFMRYLLISRFADAFRTDSCSKQTRKRWTKQAQTVQSRLNAVLSDDLAHDNNALHTEPRVARVFLLACLSPRPGERCRYAA